MPCITELHKYFYVNRIKVIKPCIYYYITPISIVHWIRGDGSLKRGLLLCTDSLSIKEVVLLINVFIIKYGIDCGIQYSTKKYPKIYI